MQGQIVKFWTTRWVTSLISTKDYTKLASEAKHKPSIKYINLPVLHWQVSFWIHFPLLRHGFSQIPPSQLLPWHKKTKLFNNPLYLAFILIYKARCAGKAIIVILGILQDSRRLQEHCSFLRSCTEAHTLAENKDDLPSLVCTRTEPGGHSSRGSDTHCHRPGSNLSSHIPSWNRISMKWIHNLW